MRYLRYAFAYAAAAVIGALGIAAFLTLLLAAAVLDNLGLLAVAAAIIIVAR